ncbi:Sugar transferase involved in LPS biosynthesis (colanic, teichoic acid) [Devosia lucknowensis]|uniref:Sugar transferase involved in LPS biosynthesis (Colanic, teichoic acid) n=1 Tax=Devosia lucknowensis TaxID=1096929 RepID=A0A1Y6FDR9_9HYPH|nr:sugar transferase [Devosia lucknowensis]SMQ72917.1 Sugar transferase involved in LPS biosynthesis (colanic, teichoic acid) [Devosia lucknowensis]
MAGLQRFHEFRLTAPSHALLRSSTSCTGCGTWPHDFVSQSGLPLPHFNGAPILPERPLTDTERDAKRVFDIVLATLALVALLPVLALLALAIKASGPGDVLFRQKREGIHGRPFEIWKFRTFNAGDMDPTGLQQTTDGDPRVFPLGRILRRYSLDELPQLINILRGEMSFVGPRPHVPGMRAGNADYRALVPHYHLRLSVLPGLTGWAQANGLRGEIASAAAARRRVDHDLAYIRNFSLWLDLRIILMTVRRELFRPSGN